MSVVVASNISLLGKVEEGGLPLLFVVAVVVLIEGGGDE